MQRSFSPIPETIAGQVAIRVRLHTPASMTMTMTMTRPAVLHCIKPLGHTPPFLAARYLRSDRSDGPFVTEHAFVAPLGPRHLLELSLPD